MARRLAIACFHDADGVVDDYYRHLVHSLSPFVVRTIFISSCPLQPASREAITACVDEIVIRDAAKTGMQPDGDHFDTIDFDLLASYDEVVIFDHTAFGPIFPFAEMFGAMDMRDCDFWGATARREIKADPFNRVEASPYYLHTHFIVLRKALLASPLFRNHWRKTVVTCARLAGDADVESRFTQALRDLGFRSSVYMDDALFDTADPLRHEPDVMMLMRSPFLKRETLVRDTTELEAFGVDVARALDIMAATSSYDAKLIWQHLLRIARLRTLNENAVLMSILPDEATAPVAADRYGSIAVCAHMYYTDMLPEILGYTGNIPVPYDFIATTDSEEKRALLEKSLAVCPGIRNAIVRVVEQNRGRDVSALFVTCRDLFADDRYDVVCRVHTKKTPQVQASRGNLFKRHMLENILNSRGYVTNILNMMVERPWIGLFMPPIVQISFNTLGHSWYANRDRAQEVAHELGLDVALDLDTPVAPYGTMYWFRPKALRKLFQRQWRWEEFNAEPDHKDGGLAHVLERITAYVAQDAGYSTQHVANARIAAQNYVIMEFKLAALCSRLPQSKFAYQRDHLAHIGAGGQGDIPGAAIHLARQIVRGIAHRSPATYLYLRRCFGSALSLYRKLMKHNT